MYGHCCSVCATDDCDVRRLKSSEHSSDEETEYVRWPTGGTAAWTQVEMLRQTTSSSDCSRNASVKASWFQQAALRLYQAISAKSLRSELSSDVRSLK